MMLLINIFVLRREAAGAPASSSYIKQSPPTTILTLCVFCLKWFIIANKGRIGDLGMRWELIVGYETYCVCSFDPCIVALGKAAKIIAGTLVPYVLGWTLQKFVQRLPFADGIIDMCHEGIAGMHGKGLFDGWCSGE